MDSVDYLNPPDAAGAGAAAAPPKENPPAEGAEEAAPKRLMAVESGWAAVKPQTNHYAER